ncbi:PP2C family protein-serine/threonine phosphatase [Pseudodesulfovibrio senegalensis]|jgi:sigma-B regulation protein RsbU (phosphoserine phosphatase)|uniref:SpoIIE family protein phosphatase n=1 Tax=Pseudodesulfovibrio senegalensis TaxID=1721087 RepID=A0A6N6N3N7_9BACT|nr:SpoIIE family protein phosphatase [Pseudodesulfovibrio senegalensis]
MDALPVRELAMVLFWPLLAAGAVRVLIRKRMVDRAPLLVQPGRQFRMDFSLFALAGLLMAGILHVVHGFPLLHSGMKLALGLVTVGLFAGLDMALARERSVIAQAMQRNGATRPPRELSPMTRRFAVIATMALLLMTALLLLLLARDMHWLRTQIPDPEAVGTVTRSILTEIAFVMAALMGLIINLIISWARNLKILFRNETEVLERVSRGELDKLVPVATNDEFGYIAGHTNEMIKGLRHGMHMRQGLQIAREIQRNFLPANPPHIPKLDCAAASRSSDETGGDFYDWIECEDGCGRTVFMVGDVVGHGIGAALLMASVRAMLRQSGATLHGPAETVHAVNRSLCRDTDKSGRFVTLFLLEADQASRTVRWVNAGHPPAIIYDSGTDTFTPLQGQGIPLGVDNAWEYTENETEWLKPGQTLLAGTDGIWETPGPNGTRFGQKRFLRVVRQNARRDAQGLLQAVMDELDRFREGTPQDDDVTLLILRAEP